MTWRALSITVPTCRGYHQRFLDVCSARVPVFKAHIDGRDVVRKHSRDVASGVSDTYERSHGEQQHGLHHHHGGGGGTGRTGKLHECDEGESQSEFLKDRTETERDASVRVYKEAYTLTPVCVTRGENHGEWLSDWRESAREMLARVSGGTRPGFRPGPRPW
jgi:hypothetical protein